MQSTGQCTVECNVDKVLWMRNDVDARGRGTIEITHCTWLDALEWDKQWEQPAVCVMVEMRTVRVLTITWDKMRGDFTGNWNRSSY